MFDNLVKQFAGKPEAAEAAWRAGQCRKELAEAKQAAARTALAKPGAKPEELTAANTAWQDALKSVRETAQYFEGQFGPIGQQAGGSTPHLRLYYEAAWCQRILADDEINAGEAEASRRGSEEAAGCGRQGPAGRPAGAVVNPPEIRITAVPMQPAEQKAREHYQALIKLKPEEQLALVARFELAEMHCPARGDRRGDCPAHAGAGLGAADRPGRTIPVAAGKLLPGEEQPGGRRRAIRAGRRQRRSRLWRPMPAIAWARRCC